MDLMQAAVTVTGLDTADVTQTVTQTVTRAGLTKQRGQLVARRGILVAQLMQVDQAIAQGDALINAILTGKVDAIEPRPMPVEIMPIDEKG